MPDTETAAGSSTGEGGSAGRQRKKDRSSAGLENRFQNVWVNGGANFAVTVRRVRRIVVFSDGNKVAQLSIERIIDRVKTEQRVEIRVGHSPGIGVVWHFLVLAPVQTGIVELADERLQQIDHTRRR